MEGEQSGAAGELGGMGYSEVGETAAQLAATHIPHPSSQQIIIIIVIIVVAINIVKIAIRSIIIISINIFIDFCGYLLW